MTGQEQAPEPLGAEARKALRSSIRDCGHAERQEVLAELRAYGRRLTPRERASASATDGAG